MPVSGRDLRSAPARGIDDASTGESAGIEIGVVLHQALAGEIGPVGFVRNGSRPFEVGYPIVLAGWQADMDIGSKRPGDLRAYERADGAARHLPQQLADREPERVDVITMPRARLPPRCLTGDGTGHQVPVQHGSWREPAPYRGDSCLVAEELPDGDGVLAGSAEFRPVPGDRLVGVQQALAGAPGREHG